MIRDYDQQRKVMTKPKLKEYQAELRETTSRLKTYRVHAANDADAIEKAREHESEYNHDGMGSEFGAELVGLFDEDGNDVDVSG